MCSRCSRRLLFIVLVCLRVRSGSLDWTCFSIRFVFPCKLVWGCQLVRGCLGHLVVMFGALLCCLPTFKRVGIIACGHEMVVCCWRVGHAGCSFEDRAVGGCCVSGAALAEAVCGKGVLPLYTHVLLLSPEMKFPKHAGRKQMEIAFSSVLKRLGACYPPGRVREFCRCPSHSLF